MHIVKTGLSLLSAALLATSTTLALAQTCNPNIPLSKPDSRYTYNAAGDEVTDSVTGLIWKRCAEGMSYSGGTCAGMASSFTWEGALAHAETQNGPSGWRLPNPKELTSLVETACINPSINLTAFPATPYNHWTSSPSWSDPNLAWYAHFANGNVYPLKKPDGGGVRLVRSIFDPAR